MQWCVTIVVLALAKSTIAAQIAFSTELQKPPSVNCTEYFAGYGHNKLDSEDILGIWYQVNDKPDQLFCINIESIDEEKRKAITAELKPYTNESNFNRFTLMARNGCPQDNITNPRYHLLSKIDDKGSFDAYYVPKSRSVLVVEWMAIKTLIKIFEVKGKTYLGILPCNVLVHEDTPAIFERQRKEPYTKQGMKDLEYIFNKNKITN